MVSEVYIYAQTCHIVQFIYAIYDVNLYLSEDGK